LKKIEKAIWTIRRETKIHCQHLSLKSTRPLLSETSRPTASVHTIQPGQIQGSQKNHQRPRTSDYRFVAAVVIVTVLCAGVYLAPVEAQDLLKVRHGVFNPLAYLTASFVHGDVMHLTINLVFFWLFGFLLYFVNSAVEKQRFFLYALLVLFTVLPLVNYSLLFYFGVYKSGAGFGLSVVDSGLIGLTLPSLIMYFRAKLDGFNSVLFLTSMSLLAFFLILVLYMVSLRLILLPLAVLVLGLFFGVFVFKRILSFLWRSLSRRETIVESCFVLLLLLFYFVSITSLFPATVLSGIGATDVVSHYIGLVFGIIPFSLYAMLISFSRR